MNKEQTQRIAIASKEGLAVSEHFGHAKRFLIYEINAQTWQFTEERTVAHYCHGNTGDAAAMADILETIKDCDAVWVAKIGDGPRNKLAAIQVEAIEDYAWEPIENAMTQFIQTSVVKKS